MLTAKDRNNLERHLKHAAQWLKKRESGWQQGMDTQQAYRIEQRLFPSLSVLSDYAEDFFDGDAWPEKPWPLKTVLIAMLQSNNIDVFIRALQKLDEIIDQDENDFFTSALWLANPKDLSTEKLDALIDNPLAKRLTETQLAQCCWQPATMRKLALQCDLALPFWLDDSEQIPHSETASLLRSMILAQPSAVERLIAHLSTQAPQSDHWTWLTLSENARSLDLFFQHCESEPSHLPVAALQGTTACIDHLLSCFRKAPMAKAAASAIEVILATPVDWQPALVDTATGESVAGSSAYPVAPDIGGEHAQALLQGQLKNASNLSAWFLNQHPQVQRMGWYHLGQLLGQVLPDMTYHWTHCQWRFLQSQVVLTQQVSHAA